MKKIIKTLFLGSCIIFCSRYSYAQFAVTDPAATAAITQTNILHQISNGIQLSIKAYSQLQSNLQQGTLNTVIQTSGLIGKHLDIINAALNVADVFNNTQMTRDFFLQQRNVLKNIGAVSHDYFSLGSQIFSNQARSGIKTNLEEASVLANKSLVVASNAFVTKQINISDRLVFIKEAQSYLTQAMNQISMAQNVIATKRNAMTRVDEKVKMYKLIF